MSYVIEVVLFLARIVLNICEKFVSAIKYWEKPLVIDILIYLFLTETGMDFISREL